MTQTKPRSVSIDPFSREVLEFPAIVGTIKRLSHGFRGRATARDAGTLDRPPGDPATPRPGGEAREYLRESPRVSILVILLVDKFSLYILSIIQLFFDKVIGRR